jgi:quinol monooxygenase YgiN
VLTAANRPLDEPGRLQVKNEPGTRMYTAWQRKDDPTRFVHLFEFADEAAHRAHGTSAAVRQFEASYGPELTDGPVVFTDYVLIPPTAASSRKRGAGLLRCESAWRHRHVPG